MAKTISELRNQSIQVRDASAAGENTATRVGTVLNDIVGHIEDYENTQSSNNSSQDAKIEGVKSSLNAEIARAKTEESNLSTQIGTERTERQAAVSREETARIQADNDEKTARQQADNAEQDARIKADNDEKTARENADITLRTMIQTEVSNRQIAVKQEEIRAMAAEEANAQAITDENARATTAEAAETARAKAEEERLQGEIDNTNTNVETLDNKVNSNHDHLTVEVARLDLTDNEIKADLEAESVRAKAAEEAIIFDVSAHNNGAVFESISALLSDSNLDTLIPVSFRHGGMTIRFIKGSEHTSDNKYVQYRLTSDSFNTTVANWINDTEHITELETEAINVSIKYPTGGTDGSNIYTTTNARNKVPEAQRKVGTVISYLTSDGWVMERYCKSSYDPTSWIYGNTEWMSLIPSVINLNNNKQQRSAFPDAGSARNSVPLDRRNNPYGLIIQYLLNTGWNIEMCISDTFSPSASYWKPLIRGNEFVIADNSVTSAKLSTNSVTTEKIENGAVSAEKLGTSSVMMDKVDADILSCLVLNISNLFPTGGTGNSNIYTVANARNKVPISLRRPGVIISYLINTDDWIVEQYNESVYNVDNFVYGSTVWTRLNARGFININQENGKTDAYSDAGSARNACPKQYQNHPYGLVIAYLLSDGWHYERCISETWNPSYLAWTNFLPDTSGFALDSVVLKKSSQELTDGQKNTVLNNLGVSDVVGKVVLFNDTKIIPKGQIRNTTIVLSNAPTCAVPAKATLTGINGTIYFTNASYQDIGSYLLSDSVETDIVIPGGSKYILTYIEPRVAVSEDTNFSLFLSYNRNAYFNQDISLQLEERRKYLPIFDSLQRTVNADGLPSTAYKNLIIPVITDLHNELKGSVPAFDFLERYADRYTDVLTLGDYVNGSLVNGPGASGSDYQLDRYPFFATVLKTIGNHDVYVDNTYTSIVNDKVGFDTWLKDDIDSWGVTYQNEKCFYYKDYTDEKVRLIVIDYMHWDEQNDSNGQINWLRNVLYNDNVNSAIAKGLHVIIASHYFAVSQGSGAPVLLNTTFNTRDIDLTQTGQNYILPDIVNEFQTRNGIFVCYLTGHMHKDMTAVYENYPNQIIIAQACTADFDWHRDSVFTHDTEYELQFNLYGVDSANKFLKIYRVGGHYDRNMQHRESMLLSYDASIQNKLISCY